MRRYLDIVVFKAWADLKAESARTYVGFLWWIIEPVMYMAIFYVIFETLFRHGTQDFVAFLFVGLIVWRWLHSTLMHGANAIRASGPLIQLVVLPKAIFPVASVLSNSVKFAVVFAILLVFLYLYGFGFGPAHLALLPLLLTQLLLIMALVLLFAAVIPFLPDISVVLNNGLQGLFFLSGIFFPVSGLPADYQFWLRLNPMAVLIEAYRDVLLYARWPRWDLVALIFVCAVAANLFALWLIRRLDRRYPKVLQ